MIDPDMHQHVVRATGNCGRGVKGCMDVVGRHGGDSGRGDFEGGTVLELGCGGAVGVVPRDPCREDLSAFAGREGRVCQRVVKIGGGRVAERMIRRIWRASDMSVVSMSM